MPVQPTYPGVYIEEVPSGVRTITGVSTAVAAFIGKFKRGPLNEPVQLFSLADFERELGGLLATSEASYAIQQFFLNGGSEAWAVRVAGTGFAKASVDIPETGSQTTALKVEAIHEGTWGDDLRIAIDTKTEKPAELFNLTVTQGAGGRAEVFRNLSMKQSDPRWVQTVVNNGSKLIQVKEPGTALPAQNGTLSGVLSSVSVSNSPPKINVTIGAEGMYTATLGEQPKDRSEARSLLESAIRSANPGNPAFAAATVEIVDQRLRILAGPTKSDARIVFAPAGVDPTCKKLGLDATKVMKAFVSGDLASFSGLTESSPKIEVDFTDQTKILIELATSSPIADLEGARTALETALRKESKLGEARVAIHEKATERHLVVLVPSDVTSLAAPATDTTTLAELKLDATAAERATVSTNVHGFSGLAADEQDLMVTFGAGNPEKITLTGPRNTLNAVRSALETALQAAKNQALKNSRVALHLLGSDSRLVVLPGSVSDTVSFSAAATDGTTVGELGLDAAHAMVNVQQYALGSGDDGAPPDGKVLIGNLNDKTGLYALEKVDLFNILCIPRTAEVASTNPDSLDSTEASAVLAAAIAYCEKRRAMFLMDTPNDVDGVQAIKRWLDDPDTPRPRHKNAALYFPRVKIADPLNEFRLRSVGASGTIAGLYARTDASRGVWKAPAGTEATLNNVQALDAKLSDAENGALNPLAINTLRNFPVYGNVSWGARTLVGADQIASEWKYIPVRRLALYLEESLYRGTQWVVFEPNDEPLWSQIRLNIGAFMQSLFRQGAFQGRTPREAYLVKCDKETTTQDDVNRGIVNILVGFAPLKPAEFVILKIQQLAGQIQT